MSRFLLDTVTFLWIVSGSPSLSRTAKDCFSDPDNSVYLSAVSSWEISVKHRLGRLPLPESPERFVPSERERHGIQPLALTEEAALQLPRLPDYHRDPFDRMLICQAIQEGLTLLTPDPLIRRYAVAVLW